LKTEEPLPLPVSAPVFQQEQQYVQQQQYMQEQHVQMQQFMQQHHIQQQRPAPFWIPSQMLLNPEAPLPVSAPVFQPLLPEVQHHYHQMHTHNYPSPYGTRAEEGNGGLW
jgi:hypothetical protein